MLKEIYRERRQERASSLVNAKSRSNTGPVCCLLPFGCPFFTPSLTVPSSLSLSVPAKASVQRLIYSQLCGRSSKNLSYVTVKVKGPWQAVAICALTLKAHLYLREKEWERENHAWRERERELSPVTLWYGSFCFVGLVTEYQCLRMRQVKGIPPNRTDSSTQIKSGTTYSFTEVNNKEQWFDHRHTRTPERWVLSWFH